MWSALTNSGIQHSRLFVLLLAILLAGPAKAQFLSLPADYFFSLTTEKRLAGFDSSLHRSFQPYIPGFSEKFRYEPDSALFWHSKKRSQLTDALFNRHLVRLRSTAGEKEEYDVFIDPLLNFQAGKDFSDASGEKLYTNTRGFIAGGRLGSNVSFEALLSENQSFFPQYIDSFTTITKVIPGQGRWKSFKTTGYDYAFASGLIAVQAGQHLNIQLGHGKHKIGHGYRSLFLSDNAFNYPYLRFTQQWFKGRLQYSNLYTVFMNLRPAYENPPTTTEALYQKNPGSFQYLSLNLWERFNLGFFQGMLWNGANGQNQQHLEFGYFNPFIFTNLPAYGLNHSQHNIVLGSEFNFKILQSLHLYGQVVLDDPAPSFQDNSEGWSYLAGVRYFDVFGIKHLVLQTEYVRGGKAVYANQDGLSYQHYNQNLATAFPFGQELIGISSYTFRRLFLHLQVNYQQRDEIVPAQGLSPYPSFTTTLLKGSFGFIVNPAYNLCLYVSGLSRLQKINTFNSENLKTTYLSFGLKTGIYNLYYDF